MRAVDRIARLATSVTSSQKTQNDASEGRKEVNHSPDATSVAPQLTPAASVVLATGMPISLPSSFPSCLPAWPDRGREKRRGRCESCVTGQSVARNRRAVSCHGCTTSPANPPIPPLAQTVGPVTSPANPNRAFRVPPRPPSSISSAPDTLSPLSVNILSIYPSV